MNSAAASVDYLSAYFVSMSSIKHEWFVVGLALASVLPMSLIFVACASLARCASQRFFHSMELCCQFAE